VATGSNWLFGNIALAFHIPDPKPYKDEPLSMSRLRRMATDPDSILLTPDTKGRFVRLFQALNNALAKQIARES
jgi:hypothetical protein